MVLPDKDPYQDPYPNTKHTGILFVWLLKSVLIGILCNYYCKHRIISKIANKHQIISYIQYLFKIVNIINTSNAVAILKLNLFIEHVSILYAHTVLIN